MNDESLFYTRHHWKASSPRRVLPLDVPVTNIVALWADTDPCDSPEECMSILRDLQKKHLSEKLADIKSNFYIGGDGNIYEGRGWYNKCPDYPKEDKVGTGLNGKCIEMAYIGRPGVDPDQNMMRGSNDLFTYGAINKYLKGKVNYYFKSWDGLHYVHTIPCPGGPQTPLLHDNSLNLLVKR